MPERIKRILVLTVVLALAAVVPADRLQAAFQVPAAKTAGISSNFYVGTLLGYNDNLFLDSTDTQAVFSQHLVPHFDLDYRTRRLSVNLDYTGDYSWYSAGGDRTKNALHYTRLGSDWNWHRDLSLQFFGDLSERPIDLTKGGGVLTSALNVGGFFRPPAINSVLTRTVGLGQHYFRRLNSRLQLEASYGASDMQTDRKYGRDVFQHGASGKLLYTWSKRLDLALRFAVQNQNYEGGIRRRNSSLVLEADYAITPRTSLFGAAGVEDLKLRNPGPGLRAGNARAYLEAGVSFDRIPRTSLALSVSRRLLSDISANLYTLTEVAVRANHELSRRVELSGALYSRSLSLDQVEQRLNDYILGSELQITYRISRDLQPMVNLNYVVNAGEFRPNDFANFRLNTGLRYYFFALN
ncbi:hypothetical protein LLH00_16880 [bacterium]|nr:hypothetical protein [bacterium]